MMQTRKSGAAIARKRSAAITLVLAGSAVLSGCSEPAAQRDVYTKLDDCARDWGNPQQCESVRDGGYSSNYYYGPPYYGRSFPSGKPRPSPNAMEAKRVPGGATQMARAADSNYWQSRSSDSPSGGIGPRGPSQSRTASAGSAGSGGSVSRGGFGTSARSSGG